MEEGKRVIKHRNIVLVYILVGIIMPAIVQSELNKIATPDTP